MAGDKLFGFDDDDIKMTVHVDDEVGDVTMKGALGVFAKMADMVMGAEFEAEFMPDEAEFEAEYEKLEAMEAEDVDLMDNEKEEFESGGWI